MTTFCEYFELGAVRRCVNLVDTKNAKKCVSGCKNRLRCRRERAISSLIIFVQKYRLLLHRIFQLRSRRQRRRCSHRCGRRSPRSTSRAPTDLWAPCGLHYIVAIDAKRRWAYLPRFLSLERRPRNAASLLI